MKNAASAFEGKKNAWSGDSWADNLDKVYKSDNTAVIAPGVGEKVRPIRVYMTRFDGHKCCPVRLVEDLECADGGTNRTRNEELRALVVFTRTSGLKTLRRWLRLTGRQLQFRVNFCK